MADGLCSGDQVDDVAEVTDSGNGETKNHGRSATSAAAAPVEKMKVVSPFQQYLGGSGARSGGGVDDNDKVRAGGGERGATEMSAGVEEVFLEEDCRKKRCVDRYDSSESSDSGVAVLSCTDCSGSSTASSDIADPGSPFSTASTHSEDSASQPSLSSSSSSTKMPPTQTAHHPPWPWTTEECTASLNKRSMQQPSSTEEKTAFPKRLKSNDEDIATKQQQQQQSPPCLQLTHTENVPSLMMHTKKKQQPVPPQQQQQQAKQGKITEYFKSQIKLHVIKKEAASPAPPKSGKLVDQQTQFNGLRPQPPQRTATAAAAAAKKPRKVPAHGVTVPRKILPAPSKLPEKAAPPPPVALNPFAPTVTLTAVGFPPNLAYLHGPKTPKPPDGGIFVPQFATISNDKIGTIPAAAIINRTPCLNVIHHHQKITAINNFNCVKLNATVVPIVKLNTLPSRLSVETAVPTVLSAKPKMVATASGELGGVAAASKQPPVAEMAAAVVKCSSGGAGGMETARRPPPPEMEKAAASPSTGDSDSGVSFKEHLEVAVGGESVVAAVPPQKSPILSQPKTIRFPPAKQEIKEEVSKDGAKTTHQQESGLCRWAECNAQFDTSGALLEHLQIKHVISQATQEQYVCLWLGCKVHGRTSCSRSWLERHVLAHAGTKPFRCIVDGCGQRFNSQLTLERHVNGHFNGDGSQSGGGAKKSAESSATKLFKRNGKKIRFRRQPWSARMFDFIDSGIMEGLQHKLLTMTEERTLGQIHNNSGNTVNVLSQVMARRVEPDGRVKFLVKWHPVDIIPDEWVSEKEYVRTKSVPIPSLQPSAKVALSSRFFPPEKKRGAGTERRRKPITKQQT